MKNLILTIMFALSVNCFAAYQYNSKGNQGWLTFDSDTTLSAEIGTSGKDKNHENFIDRGDGIVDYGWYNMNTGESGSFNNGISTSFTENDKIGLYVTDNKGNTYLSTKTNKKYPFDDAIWGKSKLIDGSLAVAGGNFGSNGTHEYYVFKVNTVPSNNAPTGQPLPGIIATVIIGGVGVAYIKKRKQLLSKQ
jgi:hypothetical protein